MTGAAVALIVLAVLMLLQYLSKRSFGLPVIGLIIGSIIAELWSGAVADWAVSATGSDETVLISSCVYIAMVVLPAVGLFFVGKSLSSRLLRIVSMGLFGAFVAVLLIDRVSLIVDLGSSVSALQTELLPMRPTIIGMMAVLATVDVMLHASPKRRGRSR